MKLAEIEEKIVELALIYQDEKQGADSAAAKKLLAELAQENSENIGKANLSLRNKIIRGKVKISQSTLGTVLNNIKATGNSNEDVTQAPTQPAANNGTSKSTTKDIAELGELLANSEKEQENQQQTSQAKPAPKKPKPVKEANDTSAPQTKPVRQRVNRNAPKAQPTAVAPQDEKEVNKIEIIEDKGLPNSLKYNLIRVSDEKPTAEKFESHWQSYHRTHLQSILGLSGKPNGEGMWCSFATAENENIGQWESWCKAQDSYMFYMEEERGHDPQRLMWKYYDFEKENKEFSWHVIPNENCRILELRSLDDIRPYLRSADGSEFKGSDAEIKERHYSDDPKRLYIDYGAMARDYDLFIMKNDEIGYKISGGDLDVDSAVVFDFNKVSVMTNDEYAAFIQKERQMYEEKQHPQAEQAEAKNSDVKMIPLPGKDIQAEIREFFNDGVDDYSDKLGDYLEDKENALKVLNFLQKNYTKRSGRLNSKVMFLALTAYSIGNKNEQFTDITRSIIEKLSELSIPGYLERNKNAGNTFFKDAFLCDIKTVNTAEYADLLNAISKKHVQDVLEKLSEDDKKKYLRMLNKKNGLEQFNPNLQNKQNSKKENTKSTETKTGDTIMTDKEVKFDYNTIDSEKSEIKVESDKSLVLSLQDKDGNMLVFTAAAQKDEKAVDAEGKETTVHHSIFDDDFPTQYAVEINGKKEVYRVSGSTNDPMDKEILELVKKQMNKKLLETLIESEARAVDGEEATIKAEREEFLKKMGKDNKEDFDEIYELLKKKKENDDSLSPEDKEKELERLLTVRNKYVPLGIDADSEEKRKGVDAPELADWIKKKIKDYKDMADGKLEGCPKLADYHHDETVKDGFVATFNGGEIHYTTPNNVTVSKESGLTIFEALVTEPDNKGRVVNFGPNLEHNQAVMLFAACVMHGNPIGENQPKISQADMDMLKEELIKQGREEDWNNFATKIKEMLGVKEETAKPKTFDDETKAKIKEALGRQYDMASLESSGLIRKLPDGTPCKNPEKKEDGTDKYSDEDFKKYLDLSGKQAEDKKFLAEKFIENPEAVRDLMKELVNEKTGKTEDKETTITDRREMVKMKMEIRNKDGANNEKAFIAERRKQLQEEMKMALGIIPNKDGEKKVDLDYIKNNHINAYTYGRLGGTSEDVAKQCGPIKEGGDVMKEFAAGKQTLKELTDKVKGGGRGA